MTDLQAELLKWLPALQRYAWSLARNRAGAEDLLQETLLAALGAAASYDRTRSMKAWLLSIMHNRHISDLRHDEVRTRYTREADYGYDARFDAPQERVVSLRQVNEAVEALPSEQREALRLVVVAGLSYHEAAAILGVPIGTLMSRIARARQRLRDAHASDPRPEARLRVVRRKEGEP